MDAIQDISDRQLLIALESRAAVGAEQWAHCALGLVASPPSPNTGWGVRVGHWLHEFLLGPQMCTWDLHTCAERNATATNSAWILIIWISLFCSIYSTISCLKGRERGRRTCRAAPPALAAAPLIPLLYLRLMIEVKDWSCGCAPLHTSALIGQDAAVMYSCFMGLTCKGLAAHGVKSVFREAEVP